MSFACCSTRLESSPVRTRDIGLHVDSARTTTSSPEATRSTGSPAASYQPHATVLGVGVSWCVLPGAGEGHTVFDGAGGGPALGVVLAETEGGAWQLTASTPLDRMATNFAR